MQNQQTDHAEFMKALRAKKLEELGVTFGHAPEKHVQVVAMPGIQEDNASDVGLDVSF